MIEFILERLSPVLDFARLFVSPPSVQFNYAHRKRFDEVRERLEPIYTSLLTQRDAFISSSERVYNNDTVYEWLSVYVEPHLDKILDLLKITIMQSKERDWPPRPLPIRPKDYPQLNDLKASL